MSYNNTLILSDQQPDILRTGLYIGVAGGLVQIAVVWLYTVFTGSDAAMVARAVAAAIGLPHASAATGVAVHMILAAALGIGLRAELRGVRESLVFPAMLGSLVAVWAFNFFILLPAVSPAFVHLLPYAVTLAAMLAFGLAAAVTTLRQLHHRPTSGIGIGAVVGHQ